MLSSLPPQLLSREQQGPLMARNSALTKSIKVPQIWLIFK